MPCASLAFAAIMVLVFELAIVYNGNYKESARSATAANVTIVSDGEQGNRSLERVYIFSFLNTAWVLLGVNTLFAAAAVYFFATSEQPYAVDLLQAGVLGAVRSNGGGAPSAEPQSAMQVPARIPAPASGAGADNPPELPEDLEAGRRAPQGTKPLVEVLAPLLHVSPAGN